jgi:hypothetical protein
MPMEAWEGQVLGEAAFIRAQLTGNASELTTYLGQLGQTLFNIGSAAQTVAEIYDAADATSAAELSDAVLFAFGDKSVPRPEGVPPNIGQTYSEALRSGDSAAVATPVDSAEWGSPQETVVSPYQTAQVSTAPNGQTREIMTTTLPGGGGTIVATTVYAANGTVLSSSRTRTTTTFRGNTQTQRVESYQGDDLTGTTTTTTTYTGGDVTDRTTTSTAPDGSVTGVRTQETDTTTGEQIETTTSVDEDGHERVTDRVVIGRETEGQRTVQDPIADRFDPTRRQVG